MPMSTDVKFFTSEMFGAPTLTNAAGKAIEMFDACLINGFDSRTVDSLVVDSNVATVTINAGHLYDKYAVIEIAGAVPAELNGEHRITSTTEKTFTFEVTGIFNQTATGTITVKRASAGWRKAFSGTNQAVYTYNKVGAGNAFYKVIDTTIGYYEMRCYDSMMNINNGTNEMLSQYRWFNKSVNNYAATWFIIANGNFCFVGSAPNLSLNNAVGGFGDIESRKLNDEYRGIIRGHNSSASVYNPSSSSYSIARMDDVYSIQKSSSGIGQAVIANIFFRFSSGGASGEISSFLDFPNGSDYSLLLYEMFCYEREAKTLRGSIPGMYCSPQYLAGKLGGDATLNIMEVENANPDKLVFIVPFSISSNRYSPAYFFVNATKWNN